MRFMIMHRTNAHWESGASPTPELAARVGELVGELVRSGALLAADGLRASSHGARLELRGDKQIVVPGPFHPGGGPPAGFAVFRAPALEQALSWATRMGRRLGDVDLEVRPVTEAWDIGLAPEPKEPPMRRWMALHKGTPESEAGALPGARLAPVLEAARAEGVLDGAVELLPTSKGARIVLEGGKRVTVDGPFAEAKELIGGYVLISSPSLAEAVKFAERYAEVVGAEVVDVREAL